MEEVYKELDDAKAEMERLQTEVRMKTELSEILKKAHNELQIKFQAAKHDFDKQSQELNVKVEEVFQSKLASESLQSCLLEKESSLRHLTFLHDKLRADSEKKLQTLEGENKQLAFSLDEVTERNKDLEQSFRASGIEIEVLKRLLSTAERKCFEAEQKAQEAKELRQRDGVIMQLEEENRNAQDQLKWKKEQFRHLEEAHRRLQDQFQLAKQEWAKDKSAMLEEISSLQTSLDSQTRILEAVQKRLEMCNQALAHEESRRKFLEVEVSEYKSQFENFSAQSQQERSRFESLTVQRDEEIAQLRNSLATKDNLTKEMEIRAVHLEQENQELRKSLKELQEDQIRNCGPSALTKLRNKLRGLEKLHSTCSATLKAKESELSLQIEKMKGEITINTSELKYKEKQIEELQMELVSCNSLIEVLNEEISVVVTIFKSELSESYTKRFDRKTESKVCSGIENEISVLTTELEKNTDSSNVRLELEQENDKSEVLMNKVRSLEITEQKQVTMGEEIQQQKTMLQESSVSQLYMKDQLLQMEAEKQEMSDALAKSNLERAEKIREVRQLEYELQNLKSSAGYLKVCYEENQEKCRQLESSLLEEAENAVHEKESLATIIKEKNSKLELLQQQVILLEVAVAAKNEEVAAFKQNKENLIKHAKEKDRCIENLQKHMRVEQEAMRRKVEAAILARIDAEKSFEQEKERLFKVINENSLTIKELQLLASSLEQDLTTALESSFTEVVENLLTIHVLTEALEKANHLTELNIEEKNKIIVDLEKEVSGSLRKLIHHEEALSSNKHRADKLEALLEANKLEYGKLMSEHRRVEGIVKQLQFEKSILLQDTTKLSNEKEDILSYVEEICNRIGEFTCEDVELMNVYQTILQRSKEEVGAAVDNELHGFSEENANTFSLSAKKLEASSTGRSPLKDVNQRQF